MRPTPVLKGKSAERFYNEINQGEISKEQQKFLNECVKLLKRKKMKSEKPKLTEIIKETEIKKELCAGCDVKSNYLQYAKNGKPYCPRCYEEVIAMFNYKR